MHLLLLFLLFLLSSLNASLESSNLLLDLGPALLESQSVCLILQTLGLPVLCLLSGLEGGVFPDSSVRIGVNLLNILGTNAIRKVCRELLLESTNR